MGCFYCQRCDQMGDSKDGECVEDPANPYDTIHHDCLTEEELDKLEAKDAPNN